MTTRNGVQMMDFYDMSKQILSPIQLLNDANVALYPIDPRGPFVSLSDPSLTTMIRLADGTGGKAVYGSNDVAGEIETAIADTDVTYSLAFYPQDEKYDGAEHKLRVNLIRGGAELRYRASYTEDAKAPVLTKASREATVNAWMQEPIEATAIPHQTAPTRYIRSNHCSICFGSPCDARSGFARLSSNSPGRF